MTSLPKDKVKSFLNRISSGIEEGSNHKKYIIKINNHRFLVPCIRSSIKKDVGDNLVDKMAKELRIETNDFVDLVRMKGKKKDYSEAYFRYKDTR